MAVNGVAQGSTTTGTAAGDRTKLGQNFDTFLKLLTTQLQNQDPLTPMDSSQFTNQLVLFSQVEQQIAQNDKLEKQLAAQATQLTEGALGYIGLDIQASGNAFQYAAGSNVDIGYALGSDAASADAAILNDKGDVVAQIKLSQLTSGAHSFKWDGKDKDGNASPAGNYLVQVTAKDSAGKVSQLETLVPGRVTGIQSTSTGVLLNVGSIQIPIEKVITAKQPATTT
ncbi:flagellar hook assembly protein FlgD [Roseiterribacter gracilis]|uniref:Basal-body rod modification protein FlgD n=1 Tax=Roseiterribacter gracilis TaxID=2812848 RepID=A0A8S8XHM7_9PROT|nr:basal-body rod modification protein FlgD [Rhodospirillales bacterium TMPK1]